MKRQFVLDQFEALFPLAVLWAMGQEQHILQRGLPLSEMEGADAERVEVQNRGLVRLLQVDSIPRPDDAALKAACDAIDFLTPSTRGLTLGHGILVRTDCWRDRALIAHELVHVGQYERFGGIEPFLRQYLTECLTVGYSQSPLEVEAVTVSARLDVRHQA